MTGTEAKPVGADRGGALPGTGGPRPQLTLPTRRTAILVLVVLAVLVGFGTWAVYGSSWFRADKVSVSGNKVLTRQQIESAAAVPLDGPLISVDTGAVRKRLLKALPRIDQVDVERSWPHTIRVKVTERTASAVLKSGAKFTEVDAGGVRFATVDSAPHGVPLVQLTPDQSPSLRHFGTKTLLRAAIAVAADLPDSLDGQATAIRVRSYDGITVELSRGRSVMWGSAEQGARKAEVLSALLKAEPHASHYDVSAPTAPAASGS
ncbi:cell division protein FtsQ [Actinacidiphila alni]|uniref:Cell division protein FtsQ n=1 Tax=Actinacidiphila alni TaxID=380248 RepID=A0A1I2GQW8_9ACTN|nr:FtsQ-type POTRA domain-containing protein [Actinacidiphila alni]SFF20015.1 cell division protein FtsQ [Actinacidiphila alni]